MQPRLAEHIEVGIGKQHKSKWQNPISAIQVNTNHKAFDLCRSSECNEHLFPFFTFAASSKAELGLQKQHNQLHNWLLGLPENLLALVLIAVTVTISK